MYPSLISPVHLVHTLLDQKSLEIISPKSENLIIICLFASNIIKNY